MMIKGDNAYKVLHSVADRDGHSVHFHSPLSLSALSLHSLSCQITSYGSPYFWGCCRSQDLESALG